MSGPISVPNTFGAAITGTTPQLDANFAALTAAFNNPLTYAIYSVDSGAVNAYVATLAPAPSSQASLLGVVIAFKATTANTAASTLNVNSLGVQAIVRANGSPVSAGDIVGTVLLVWNGTNYALQTSAITLPLFSIVGFALTTASITTYDIALGQATDSTNATTISGAALTAKSQSAWAAGSAAGGKLSAAAMTTNTWYYWYAIKKDADASVDYGFDVSSTAPTMPGGYTYFRYIGGRKTQAASTNWETFIQHGDEVSWSTPPALDVNGALTAANRVLTTMNIPAIRVKWFGQAMLSIVNNTLGFILTDPLGSDVAPGNGATPLASFILVNNTAGATNTVGTQLTCWANASSQIGIRALNTGATPQIQTLGWIDPRGKPV